MTPTDAETKASAQAAIAILTATVAGIDPTPMINGLPDAQIVLASLAGIAGGIIGGWNEQMDGAGDWFLAHMGAVVEAMPA